MNSPTSFSRSIITTAVAVWAISLSPVSAERTPTQEEQERYQRKLFELIDANEDGKVTEKEFAIAILWDEFRLYDTNRDKKVSKAEFLKRATKKDKWSDLDPDGKGHVTFEDCLKSKMVVDGLRRDWRELTKRLRKPNAKHVTLADLPDLTD